MHILPSPEILLAFTAASLLLILTPGPDMTLMVGQTLQSGRARGFAALAGATTGLLLHSLLVAFGLSALLVASATAFTVVKVAGVGYLLWLAYQALRHGTALSVSHKKRKPQSLGKVFLMGLTVILLNPKIVMFFLTFLPQFVSVSDPHAAAKLFFFGVYFTVLGAPTCAVLVLLADRFTAALQRSPRAMRVFDWLFAGLMGAFAARLLVARGN